MTSDTDTAAPRRHPVRPFYWTVRRELWEHRWLYILPVFVAGIALLAILVITFGLPVMVRNLAAMSMADQSRVLSQPYDMVAMALIVTVTVASLCYSLIAPWGEHLNRSLLFWKSLPVSDATTVLAKVSLPLLFMPLFGASIIIALHVIMHVLGSLVLMITGLDAGILWSRVPLFDRIITLIYGLTTFILWYAPIFTWCLLASAVSRWIPPVWAVLIPTLVPQVFEQIAFGSRHVTAFFMDRLTGSFGRAFTSVGYTGKTELAEMDPLKFFSSPDVWLGLILAAAFIAGAIWFRRYRQPT